MYVFQTLNTWKIIHWAVYDNISNKSMLNNAQSGHPGYEQSSSDIRAMLHVFCTNGQIPSGYCSVSSNFSFSIRAGHGAKGDPWRNYMGKGKLEIGGMVIRISVQYRDSAKCNIATDQAKLLHFSLIFE